MRNMLFVASAILVTLLAVTESFAQTKAPVVLQMNSIPTGLRPLGVEIVPSATRDQFGYAVVANSGDDSVSIFTLQLNSTLKTITPVKTVTGIPSPYSIAVCPASSGKAIITSPSDNSVRVLEVPSGNILGTLKVGPQPYSVACFGSGTANAMKAVVSNLGDNSLTVFDVTTLSVLSTIPNVPGSRGFHGIGIIQNSSTSFTGWVAGTDANTITIVDLVNPRVLTQIPVSRPTALRADQPAMWVSSTANNNIAIYDASTLHITLTFQNVPNPQDFIIRTGLGRFATIGGGDALWRDDETGSATSTSTIPGIPGAAALTATSFGFNAIPASTAVLVTSTASNSVFLIQQQPGTPHDFSISNGASFIESFRLAPGVLASAFASTGATQNFNTPSVPLPRTLGSLTLSIGGSLSFDATLGWKYSSTGAVQAPLLFVGPNQINFQIPPGIATGSAIPAQLTKPDGTTLLTTLNITATAPGIFTVLQNGQGQAAVLNQDNTANFGTNPAKLGSVIQIYATGGGDTTPSLAPGDAAPASGNPLILTNAQPTVTIGGQPATVQFSGMAPGFVGLWQINAQIPQTATPGNAVPLTVSSGGVSSNTVTIAVQ